VDAAEAEALLLNGITAWQMLHRKAQVHAGQTILVHGASGGVGIALVQLARGGTLVAYGTADQLVDGPSVPAIFASIIARFAVWNATPNGRRALFYNFWGGKSLRPARFRRHLAGDLTSVLGLLAEDAVVARIADRIPLREAARALELADTRSVPGKVVLVP
jgi:NADPH:quinone reductase-like Zn-dependent oxidoreductase